MPQPAKCLLPIFSQNAFRQKSFLERRLFKKWSQTGIAVVIDVFSYLHNFYQRIKKIKIFSKKLSTKANGLTYRGENNLETLKLLTL